MCDSPKTGTIRWVYKREQDRMVGIVNGLMFFQITQIPDIDNLKFVLECLVHTDNGEHSTFEFNEFPSCTKKANEIYMDIVNAVFPSKIGE